MQQEQDTKKLDGFVTELIKARGMADEPELHAKILEEINSRIDQAILEALPGNDLDTLENDVKNGTATEEGVKTMLENSNMDAEEIITTVLEEYRDEFLSGRE